MKYELYKRSKIFPYIAINYIMKLVQLTLVTLFLLGCYSIAYGGKTGTFSEDLKRHRIGSDGRRLATEHECLNNQNFFPIHWGDSA